MLRYVRGEHNFCLKIGHYPCQVNRCVFSAESNYKLLSHYRIVHRGDLNFSISCMFPDCSHSSNFHTEDALRKHLVKFHSVPETDKDNLLADRDTPNTEQESEAPEFGDTVTEDDIGDVVAEQHEPQFITL